MKRTTQNLLQILKGQTIALARAQKDYEKSGNRELAERRKYQRWELEHVIDMLENPIEFNVQYELYARYLKEDAE